MRAFANNFWVKLILFPLAIFAGTYLCYGKETLDLLALSPAIFFLVLVGGVLIYIHIWEARPKIDRIVASHKGKNLLWAVFCILCFPFVFAYFLYWCGIEATEFLETSQGESPSIYKQVLVSFMGVDNKPFHGSVRASLIIWELGLIGMLLFSGIAVSFIVGYLERHRSRWEDGQIYYSFSKKKYIAVIGSSDTIPSIIRQAERKYNSIDYYIVFTDKCIGQLRNQLSSQLDNEIFNRIILYKGDRDSASDLTKLEPGNPSLKAIYIIGDNNEDGTPEDGLDSKNLQCVRTIVSICNKKHITNGMELKTDCYMMFDQAASYNAFIKNDIPDDFTKHLNFTPFNFYETWAQKVLSGAPNSGSIEYLPIDKGMNADSEKYVHIVIAGMSKMGIALADEAALICHYPNFAKAEMEEERNGKSDKSKLRTRITFIDDNAEANRQKLFAINKYLFKLCRWAYVNAKENSNVVWNDSTSEYKHLYEQKFDDPNFMDIEWVFIDGSIENPNVRQYIEKEADNERCLLTMSLCFPSDDENITAASYLPENVYTKAQEILIYQRRSKDIAELLAGKYSSSNSYLNKIRPFGMVEECFDHEILDTTLAKLIHYCKKNSDSQDISTMNWNGKKLIERWSSIYSSHSWYTKLRSLDMDFAYYLKENKKFHPAISAFLTDVLEKMKYEGEKVTPDNPASDDDLVFAVNGRNYKWKQKSEEAMVLRDLYGRTEHNRWITERLLKMNQRPMTNEEFSEYGTDFKRARKNAENEPFTMHPDICSNWHLTQYDPEVIEYDQNRIDRFLRIFRTYADLTYNK